MKTLNILIPSDFSLSSLNAIPGLIRDYPDQKFNISLVHFLKLSDSISDLLLLSRRSKEYRYIKQEFYDECYKLKTQYEGQIESLNPEFFYGNTVAVFKNYLENKETDMIAYVQNHLYVKLTPNSLDPTLLLQRSSCKLIMLQPFVKPQTEVSPQITAPELELLQV